MTDEAAAEKARAADVQAVVAANIVARRETLGLSQRALAVQADVNRPFLRQVELGAAAPTVVFLARLAGPLNTTVSALTRGI